jgi:hypothetical protein
LRGWKCDRNHTPYTFISRYEYKRTFQNNETLVIHIREVLWVPMIHTHEADIIRIFSLPTAADFVRAINTLCKKSIHGVDGMLGSPLDCTMQTRWKNCPVEWYGCFKGRSKGMPSIVLLEEAAANHHLWFWHASYGYPGSLNDMNTGNFPLA